MKIQNENILLVGQVNSTGQKLVTIPQTMTNIQAGDFIRVEKVNIKIEGVN